MKDTQDDEPAIGAVPKQVLDSFAGEVDAAALLLKAMGHPGRLMILCHLVGSEKSVTDLEDMLGARQASVSQQLSRLRFEGLVKPRRVGKSMHYSLADARLAPLLSILLRQFCGEANLDTAMTASAEAL
ncbi:MAG: metalloregulator ArsR/SmtB family transcription factor [Pseudomonadota bacterium]